MITCLTHYDKYGKEVRRYFISPNQHTIIGRSEFADITISDNAISRRHCAMDTKNGKLTIQDLGSSNGTYVNGEKIEKTVIVPGDILQISSQRFKVSVNQQNDVDRIKRIQTDENVTIVDEGTKEKNMDILETVTEEDFERELLRKRYKESAERLNILYRIGNLMNEETNPERLFNLIIDTILDATPTERIALLLADETDKLVPKASKTRASEDGFRISHTITHEVLKKGVSILSANAMDDQRFSSEHSIITENVRSVICVPLKTSDIILGVLYADTNEKDSFDPAMLQFFAAVGKQAGIAIQGMRLYFQLQENMVETIQTLVSAIEAKDVYTKGHSVRVNQFTVAIARALDMGESEIERIRMAAILHDVGKIAVPESILNKMGTLNPTEWDVIRNHPEQGWAIINTIRRAEKFRNGILHHHERWDGKGYPAGLKEDTIPMDARIIAVADAFDAMISDRSYRKALTLDQAIAAIRMNSGSQFDPEIAEIFLKFLEKEQTESPPAKSEADTSKTSAVG